MRIDKCPNCSEGFRVKKKECVNCGLQIEGDFEENPLTTLPREEQDFVLYFVMCGGNFKALSENLGLTYPTLRSRLDRIIECLKSKSDLMTVDEILDAIDKNKLSPEEGIKKMSDLKKKGKYYG